RRLLLVANSHELGAPAERQRRISLSEGHLEPEHRGAIFLLECLHDGARLDDDDADRPAIEFDAALDDRRDYPVGLAEFDRHEYPRSIASFEHAPEKWGHAAAKAALMVIARFA